jgi:hypothetical protein
VISALCLLLAGSTVPLQVRTITPSGPSTLKGRTVYTNSHALLVGIDEYKFQNKLEYAVRDVEFVQKTLVEFYGFPYENVHVLKNEKATGTAILKALASLADPARVGPDDRVLVFFACHGVTGPTRQGGDQGYLIPWDDFPGMDRLSEVEGLLRDMSWPSSCTRQCDTSLGVWPALTWRWA